MVVQLSLFFFKIFTSLAIKKKFIRGTASQTWWTFAEIMVGPEFPVESL